MALCDRLNCSESSLNRTQKLLILKMFKEDSVFINDLCNTYNVLYFLLNGIY
jgi:hypothetical protein